MDYQIELSDSPVQPTMAIRTRTSVTDLPRTLAKIYPAIAQHIIQIGEQLAGPGYTAYYNMDMNDLDIEAGFITTKTLPGQGEIFASQIPAGKQVSCMYKGTYTQMALVYDAMNEWMAKNNYVPTGIVYELYYNSPGEVPETELLTKIVFPVNV